MEPYRIINPNPTLDHHQNHVQQQNLDLDSTTQSKTPSPPPLQQHDQQVQLEATSPPVRYRECLKNHAANIGGNITDGCGEFMPGGEQGTSQALKCAACDCHRNFHRKDYCSITPPHLNTATATAIASSAAFYPTPSRHSSLYTMPSSQSQQQHYKLPHNYFYAKTTSTTTAPIMMSFGSYGGGGGAVAGESSSEDHHLNMYNIEGGQGSKKRFRTKFTQEQKEKMNVFAEKVGWKIQKQDEQELQQFCDELGIKRQVFKVWMHNNKQAMKKKDI